ncbi:MAG: GTPase ObgE [Chloroflexota bacterium]
MFVDEVDIEVCSGKGGDGMVHFHKEKYVNRGGPDGGDGGKGGDIRFRVNTHMNTLEAFRHRSVYVAEDGKRGGVNNMTGKSAPDLVIEVPPGTLITELSCGDVLFDLVEDGEDFVACPGGRGGRGNPKFANARRQAPRVAEKGEPGQEKRLHLELKLIADIGIIGMPNAGKSSLLAAVTNAKPKIANYPFTTLVPNLGVVVLSDEVILVLADIPGLIEGAHTGLGLGDAFLKHIQRTKVLIHLLDGSSQDPLADYAQINTELSLFDPELGRKPQVVALNKIDMPEVAERLPEIEKIFKKKGVTLNTISALTHQNLEEILWKAHQELVNLPVIEEQPSLPVYRPEAREKAFEVARISNGWQIKGEAIERAAAMTYWEYFESVRRFHRILESMGVETAMLEAGVQEGDRVLIGKHELVWSENWQD